MKPLVGSLLIAILAIGATLTAFWAWQSPSTIESIFRAGIGLLLTGCAFYSIACLADR